MINETVILELAKRWELEADPPSTEDLPEEADDRNVTQSCDRTYRECKRECADALRSLVDLITYH